ncbi:hypothetical protein CR513_50102, partial [Mucuna pruriens]
MAIWEDLYSSSSSEDDKQANICLMLKKEIEDLKFSHPKFDQIGQSYKFDKLKEEIICLKTNLTKFVEGLAKLYLLLKNKRHPYEKFGIGYNKQKDISSIKRCFVCNSIEHVEQACIPMKRFKRIVKKSNPKGPRKIWIAKSQNFPIAYILGGQRKDFTLVLGEWMLTSYDERHVNVPRPQTTCGKCLIWR